MNERDYENAKTAFEVAAAQAAGHAQKALEAMQAAEKFAGASAKELFETRAKWAAIAADNWRKAADVALKAVAEWGAGRPLPK